MKRIPLLLILFIFFSAHDIFGQVWRVHRNGIPLGSPYGGGVTTVLGDGTNIYAASSSGYNDSGLYYASNDTAVFSRGFCSGLGTGDAASLVKYDGKLFLGLSSGVKYSSDSGHTWHGTPAQPGSNPAVRCLYASHDTLYAGVDGFGIYRTTDTANSWVHLGNTGLDTQVFHILTINGRLFSAGINNLQYTTDDGATWTTVPSTSGVGAPRLGLLSKDTAIFVATYAGLFRSNDYGITWSHLLTSDVSAMVFVDSFLVVSLFWPVNKVEISDNNGSSFAMLNSGLSINLSSAVKNFSYNDDYLMLGIWSGCPCIDSTIYVIGRNELPLAFHPAKVNNTQEPSDRYSIYPNPASDKLTIDYSGHNNQSILCTISDIAGRTIDEFICSGSHNEVPLHNISPGVYVLRLKDGTDVITRKLVISN